jgi:hypothetical protein
MAHNVYSAIVSAIKTGKLQEPFSKELFRISCPGFGGGTYNAFSWKHRQGNGKTSELFVLVSPGQFHCLRPFRYEL